MALKRKKSTFPAAVIDHLIGEKEGEERDAEEINDGSGIEEAVGEIMQMLLRRDVVEEGSASERLAPDDRDVAEEVLDHQQADGDDAGDDLAGC